MLGPSMGVRIAIHHRPGSFSERWIRFCEENGIEYRRVDGHASDVVSQLHGCQAFMWHWEHANRADGLVAPHVIRAAHARGLLTFPDPASCDHFDDKIAQKYLLEALDAPLVPTWVFLEPESALRWVRRASWPKVFKLRRGAGATNVHLVRSEREAEGLVRRAFGRGFPPVASTLTHARHRARQASAGELARKLLRAPAAARRRVQANRALGREGGYVYFQEFLPGNEFDTRVVVIGERAFALRRGNRPGDFRASGSGLLDYDPEKIPREALRLAFDLSARMGFRCMGYDFLVDGEGRVRIAEMSYGYPVGPFLEDCPGYWDPALGWHEGRSWPQDGMVLDLARDAEGERPERRGGPQQ